MPLGVSLGCPILHDLPRLRGHEHRLCPEFGQRSREGRNPYLKRGRGVDQNESLAPKDARPSTGRRRRLEGFHSNRDSEGFRDPEQLVKEMWIVHP